MTAGNGLTVSYTSYNKPTSITRGTTTVGQPRPRSPALPADGARWDHALFGHRREVHPVRRRHSLDQLPDGGGMHVKNSDETVSTRYFHKDHLGSIAVITDESGAVLERLSYDAWGKRRHADGSDDPSGSITSQSSRGFTGHEELDSVGLVHMNGRVAACPSGRRSRAQGTRCWPGSAPPTR